MATEPETEIEGYVKPDPAKSPRNISLGEIAAAVHQDHLDEIKENEKVPSVDDDGVITPAQPVETAPVEEPAAPLEEPAAPSSAETEPAPAAAAAPVADDKTIDPAKEYEVTVDGQKIKVPGQKIIDAGYRTFQKETAADFRLQVATELQREVERRLAATPVAGTELVKAAPPAGDISDADLAKAIQFGNEEQSTAAITKLRDRGINQDQIIKLAAEQARFAARDENAYQEGLTFVKTEYADLLKNDHLKRLFFAEEQRFRAPKEKGGVGDTRPYVEVYKDIGEGIRKSFNLSKPAASTALTATAAGRKELKASTPPVPRTAASRLQEQTAPKAKTAGEVIAGMAASRGQGRLTTVRKE